ncbi:MAG: lipopolysaccharide biosynthesis protein [Erysipelotrichales bacterium]|nr:lipopolysaccharide biosynthesis protein [Erysipelotrichales bacterium]
MDSNVRKNFIWNVLGSTLNATTSLFFLIIVTRLNGVNDAGIFTFAFSTACLLEVIGTYYGRAYQVTERDKKFSNSDFLYSRYFSCALMMLAAFIFSFSRSYSIYKIIIILLLAFYKMLEAFSESLYATIQKNNELYKVGISLFLKGLCSLVIFIFTDYITNNIIFSIIGMILIYILLILFYDIKNVRLYNEKKTRFDNKKIMLLFKSGFFTFLFTLLIQYIINAPRYAIDNVLSDNYQTIFGIIVMPATVIILFGQFMIHPFLVRLTNQLNEKKIGDFCALVAKLGVCLFIIGFLANVVAYFIGIPFLELVYGLELKEYLLSLLIIISGATLYGVSFIISNALIAMRKTKVQCVIYIIASLFALVISNILVNSYGVFGATLAYLGTMTLILIMYIIVFIRETKKLKLEVDHE